MAELLPNFSAAGITAVFEAGIATMPTETGYDGYQQLEKENKLPVRVVGTYYWNNPETEDPVANGAEAPEQVQLRTGAGQRR